MDHPIKIDAESWEVALVEIATPSEVLNIRKQLFLFTFLDQSSLRRVKNQNITDICSSKNGCYNFKLTIPTGNYESHEFLAEEMQNSIDHFEKGILKNFNAHITMTYDHLSQRFKISAQNERLVRLIFSKQFAQILGLDSSLFEKPMENEENVFKKVQVGKDQENAQSEKDSHSKNRGGKNQTNNQVLIP